MVVHPDKGIYQTMQWEFFFLMKKRKQILYMLIGIITSIKWRRKKRKKKDLRKSYVYDGNMITFLKGGYACVCV